MLFDEMISIAQNAAAQQGGRLGFNDTICVARTVSGRIIIGISSSMMMNNMPMTVHAEVDLCNKLMADADTAVAEMSLFSAANLQPVLPCMECVGRLVSLNAYNAGTILILPDRCVPLSQMANFMQNPNMFPPNTGMGAPMGNMGGYPQPNPYGSPAGQQSLTLEQLQGMSPMQSSMRMSMNVSRPLSSFSGAQNAEDSGLMKNRLNKLFSDEPDEEPEEKEKPKKKFSLFK